MVVDDNVTEYELFEKKQLKILKKFKFSEIPFMSYKNLDGRENYNKYKDGEILICYSTEKKIPGIVFKIDSRQTHSKESLHEIRFALRMSNELGIKNIIFLNEVASGKESINNGDLVILRDLIDLSSENCLFGSNNEEWGTRFPDFSDPYQSNELNEIAKNSYIPAKQSVVSFVPDPIFDSPHLLQSSKYLKFDVSSAGSIYQTSVSRHMKMKVYALGLVHWDLKNNKIHYNSKENRDNASKNLNNLLSNLLIKKF
ncbi:purine-nucleoside phosphorylase [Anaeramoeba flamelloides]|nr:hypothetical protein M0812_24338 [Anaeramoeba flamelloides]KAJ6254211.1 purine-nucleoside phosphorylase [Anaeramoeba flamelloides]